MDWYWNLPKSAVYARMQYKVKVWQKRGRYGNTYWKVYDPMTGKHFYSGLETDAIASNRQSLC